MKRSRADEVSKPIARKFAIAIDYSIDEAGKPTIYEIQQLRSSATSELSKFSHTRARKKQQEVLARLGITEDFDEFSLDYLGKLNQRQLLASCGLQEYQPKFTHFNPQNPLSETKKTITDFLSANPSATKFVVKKNMAARGEGNFFFTREELESLNSSPQGLSGLEIESTVAIFNPFTKTQTISKKHRKIAESEDNFVVEEFRNPQVATADPKTFRSYVVYDPDSKDFRCQTLRIYHHAPASSDSHSYKYAGAEDDFSDGYHFEFDQKTITKMDKIEKPEENPITQEHLKRIVTTAFDLRILPSKFQNVTRVSCATQKPSHTSKNYVYAKAAQALYHIIKTPKYVSALRLRPETFLPAMQKEERELEDFLDQVYLENPIASSKEVDKEIKNWGVGMVKNFLPFFQIEDFRKNFDRTSVDQPNLHYIKKLLGFLLIGDLDKGAEDEARYAAYKERFDRFLATPLNPAEIEDFTKRGEPFFKATEPALKVLEKGVEDKESATKKPKPVAADSLKTAPEVAFAKD